MNIILTEKAAEVLKDAIESQELKEGYLAFYVSGGGCSGLQYGLALADGEPEIEDIIVFDKNIKIAVDSKSAKYVSGSTIDYVETSMGGGFKVVNPNKLKSCGCGKSFSVDSDDMPESTGCGSCTKY
jgi:iron-sulfur cluster assembly accessory protein